MIGRVAGKLVELEDGMLLVDVGGVCYEIEVAASVLSSLPRPGDDITLHTHFVVREDAQLLFGFATRSERELFRAFIRLNGVGPKLGLSLISALDPQTLVNAVHNNDVSMLTQVKGVGKTTAERLLLELKNRIDTLTELGAVPARVVSVGGRAVDAQADVREAEEALISLGFKPQDAARAVVQVSSEEEGLSVEAIVRRALRSLAGPIQGAGVREAK